MVLGTELANIFLEVVEEKIRIIIKNPFAFAIKYREVRQALLIQFPFAIYYIIEDLHITVLAVIHTRRNPEIWQERKK